MRNVRGMEIAQNRLLSALKESDRVRLMAHFITVDLAANATLFEAGQQVTQTWFPCAGALAAFSLLGSADQQVDVAFVGSEGALGGIVSHGELTAYSSAFVRVPGRFLKIPTSKLEDAKLESITLRHWFARYADCLLAQIFQNAACNAIHSIRQRLARLILDGLECSGQSRFAMTQDQLAAMLGVGRTFVSRVLGELRAEGIIETRRGHIVVKDMSTLKSLSCDCSIRVNRHFDSVLGALY